MISHSCVFFFVLNDSRLISSVSIPPSLISDLWPGGSMLFVGRMNGFYLSGGGLLSDADHYLSIPQENNEMLSQPLTGRIGDQIVRTVRGPD